MDSDEKGKQATGLDDYLIDNTIDLNPMVLGSSITDTISITGPGQVYSVGTGAVGAGWTTTTSAPVYSIGTGANGIDWSTISNPTTITQSGLMELRGENADLKINGRSLMDAIAALEQRLNILVPNPELEAEWDELRELGERYRELEKKCQEKGEMWKKLKQMPPPEVR